MKTTRITIETESLLMVRKGRTFITWRPSCGAETEAMTLEDGSLFKEMTSLPAAGKLHLWSTDGGPAHICLSSLQRCFESDNAPTLRNRNPLNQEKGDRK